jgi:hypothetical protein
MACPALQLVMPQLRKQRPISFYRIKNASEKAGHFDATNGLC